MRIVLQFDRLQSFITEVEVLLVRFVHVAVEALLDVKWPVPRLHGQLHGWAHGDRRRHRVGEPI